METPSYDSSELKMLAVSTIFWPSLKSCAILMEAVHHIS